MDIKTLVKDLKLFLFDLDGTLYCGEKIFPFTKPLLEEIKKQGKIYKFITNNSSKSPEDYAIKMRNNYGLEVEPADFVTSGSATARFLYENYADQNIFVLGTESLKNEFRNYGLTVSEKVDDIGCIVVGYDTELSFKKVDDACNVIFSRQVPYIATHPDKTCPTNYGFAPDCGAICDMIETATGKTPIFIGKPAPLMPEICMQMTGIDRSQTVVIGDKMTTDILSGLRSDTKTILVLSGDNTIDDALHSTYKPDVVLKSCEELLTALKEIR